ncbi:hypothetical protein [Planococcus sp. 107-1]|uniref:hypothetical protein n=1 Tax=Planococcus sp. 107-1 TaxID=2908840 RepID=UPI001F172082|nr:hypothetical protein [Planococcus sp. 107-1]UJF27457.1 hypothetical protein L0M13_02890 [Planococcus sp. 107-1]
MKFLNRNTNKAFAIEIDGKQVDLKINRAARKLYKSRFKLDLFKAMEDHLELEKMNLKQSNQMAQIVWAFAKTSDPKIPEYEEWIETFEVFPLADIFTDIVTKLKESRGAAV